MATVTRRRALAALAPLLGAGAASRLLSGEAAARHSQVADGHDPNGDANGHGPMEHASFRRGGRVDHARNGFDPTQIVRDFDERTTRRLPSGRVLREWEAYATGALALGAFLVVGFAIHNTTEGLAIVAPLGPSGARASVDRLAVLGLLAGGPAVLGARIGAAAFTPSLAAFLLGVGVGAIAQVIVQIAPGLRDAAGRILDRAVAGGIAGGMLVMYATGLLVSA